MTEPKKISVPRKILFFLVLILFTWICFEIFFLVNQKNEIDQLKEQELRELISEPALVKQEQEIVFPLVKEGVIKYTNIERMENNLALLIENQILNNIAKAKAEDMIKYDYFAHVSPKQEEISDLAQIFNYDFIIIAENLAYGGFKGDKEIVDAWMKSSGHRENILNPRFKEIGVSVIQKSERIWVAVQVFALPRSVCPEPDQVLFSEITERKSILKELEDQNKIREYNKLVRETRYLIDIYNNQIKEINNCLEYWLN